MLRGAVGIQKTVYSGKEMADAARETQAREVMKALALKVNLDRDTAGPGNGLQQGKTEAAMAKETEGLKQGNKEQGPPGLRASGSRTSESMPQQGPPGAIE